MNISCTQFMLKKKKRKHGENTGIKPSIVWTQCCSLCKDRQRVWRGEGSVRNHTSLYLSQHPASVTIETPSTVALAPISCKLFSQPSLSLQQRKQPKTLCFYTTIHVVPLAVSERLQNEEYVCAYVYVTHDLRLLIISATDCSCAGGCKEKTVFTRE